MNYDDKLLFAKHHNVLFSITVTTSIQVVHSRGIYVILLVLVYLYSGYMVHSAWL